jgi:hypothetical protein
MDPQTDLIVINKFGLDKGFRLGFLLDIAIGGNNGRYFRHSLKRVACTSQPSYSGM